MEVLRVREVLEDRKDLKRRAPNSLLFSIGNTPLIQIRHMTRHLKGVEIFAKAEWLNPGGSVKDRAGLRIIEEGERSGQLTRDKIILDSTSGNTGIAYAMIGAIWTEESDIRKTALIVKDRKNGSQFNTQS